MKSSKNVITKNYFFSLIFVLLVFSLSFSFLSFSVSFLHENDCETLAKVFDQYKKNDKKKYVYSEVSSSSENDSFSNFFYYADDLAGSETKNSTDTFFFSKYSSSFIPLSTDVNSIEIGFSSFQYTSWSLKKHHYGFQLLSKKTFEDLDKNEAYITDTLANELNVTVDDVLKIKNHVNNSYSFKIVGIIDASRDNKIFKNDLIDSRFLFTKYYDYQQMASRKKYCAYFNNEFVSTTYSLKMIEGSINRLDNKKLNYASVYYNQDGNAFYVGSLQQQKTKIFSMKPSISSFILFFYLFCLFFVAGIYLSRFFLFSERKSRFHLFESFIIYEIVMTYLPILKFSSQIINPFGTNSGIVSLLFLLLALLTVPFWKMVILPKVTTIKGVQKECIHI